jgi:cytoskeleton protein RodZ
MATLGQELKKERESRNISLDEMAASTKIVARYLQALEEDRFDIMPGGFFIKGIIRTYAGYVGLDTDAVLAKYQAAGLFDEPVRTRDYAPAAAPDAARRNRLLTWILIGAGILLLLVVLTLVWRSRRHRAVVPTPPAQTALPQARPPTVLATQPLQGDSPSTPPARQPAAEPAPIREEWKGLTMDISFQEETWLQVDTDGTPKIDGLFPAGGKARAQAEKEILIIVLGNAGGLTFTLNGQPGKVLGRSGEVLNNVRITLDNQKEFLQNRPPMGPSN